MKSSIRYLNEVEFNGQTIVAIIEGVNRFSEEYRDIVRTVSAENGVENPDTASGVAQEINTSLQNVNYHLNNLLDAGLVTDVGTLYASKGRNDRLRYE